MIPKKIHYCWFGENDIPEKDKKNFETWKKFCPDFEIIEWNESNYDVTKIPYIKEAYEAKKYAFVSDYARLDIIYQEGGIYMDTDVELLKNIDEFLKNEVFCGRQRGGKIGLGLIMGGVRGASVLKRLMDYYNDKHFILEDGSLNLAPIGEYTDGALLPIGLTIKDVRQDLEGLTIYPSSYFDPYDFYLGTSPNKAELEKAYAIHHYNATWIPEERRVYLEKMRALTRKYGAKKVESGRAGKIENYKEDIKAIKEENGFLKAMLFAMEHFFGAYFGK